jgi:hypothetical protein
MPGRYSAFCFSEPNATIDGAIEVYVRLPYGIPKYSISSTKMYW